MIFLFPCDWQVMCCNRLRLLYRLAKNRKKKSLYIRCKKHRTAVWSEFSGEGFYHSPRYTDFSDTVFLQQNSYCIPPKVFFYNINYNIKNKKCKERCRFNRIFGYKENYRRHGKFELRQFRNRIS